MKLKDLLEDRAKFGFKPNAENYEVKPGGKKFTMERLYRKYMKRIPDALLKRKKNENKRPY